jgi:hypothetical protein
MDELTPTTDLAAGALAPPAVQPGPAPADTEDGVWAEEREFHVVVRLQGGEELELEAFMDEDAADARAREVIAEVTESGEWPKIRGRYVRPESVASVEVDERRPKVWSGSASRGRWAKKPS